MQSCLDFIQKATITKTFNIKDMSLQCTHLTEDDYKDLFESIPNTTYEWITDNDYIQVKIFYEVQTRHEGQTVILELNFVFWNECYLIDTFDESNEMWKKITTHWNWNDHEGFSIVEGERYIGDASEVQSFYNKVKQYYDFKLYVLEHATYSSDMITAFYIDCDEFCDDIGHVLIWFYQNQEGEAIAKYQKIVIKSYENECDSTNIENLPKKVECNGKCYYRVEIENEDTFKMSSYIIKIAVATKHEMLLDVAFSTFNLDMYQGLQSVEFIPTATFSDRDDEDKNPESMWGGGIPKYHVFEDL